MKYWLYIPKNVPTTTKMPLIVFLHGYGEGGSNINLVKTVGIPKLIAAGTTYNAIIIAPQSSTGCWDASKTKIAKQLIDNVVATYNIDKTRISLTGHSQGGRGCYILASNYPTYFSGIAPISGFVNSSDSINISNLTKTPVKAYHGSNDTTISYSSGNSIVTKIKNAGGNATMVKLSEKNHSIVHSYNVYSQTDVINWLLSQKR